MREYYRYMTNSTINDLGGTDITGFQNEDGKISAGDSNACRQEKCYSTITDGIPDKCGKPRLSCKETLFSPYVSLYYRTKIK